MSPSDPTIRHSEEELLHRARCGEARALGTLERWAWEVVRFGPYGIPRDDRDDLVQLTLTATWRLISGPDFVLTTGLRPLVRRIAAARCVDWLRRRKPHVDIEEQTIASTEDPIESLEAVETVDLLTQALARLEESCREMIRLYFYEQLSYREIASRLGRAEATMRVRMFNCMKRIRRFLSTKTEIVSSEMGRQT